MNSHLSKEQGVSLSVSRLHKNYNGIEVLKVMDLEVSPEEIFVITGPSGAGKSVWLRQLIGLDEPDQGKVLGAQGNFESGRVREIFELPDHG